MLELLKKRQGAETGSKRLQCLFGRGRTQEIGGVEVPRRVLENLNGTEYIRLTKGFFHCVKA